MAVCLKTSLIFYTTVTKGHSHPLVSWSQVSNAVLCRQKLGVSTFKY